MGRERRPASGGRSSKGTGGPGRGEGIVLMADNGATSVAFELIDFLNASPTAFHAVGGDRYFVSISQDSRFVSDPLASFQCGFICVVGFVLMFLCRRV